MQLTSFQTTMYRNILDSGPVEVTSVTALVGQNECGKSNLLEALSKLNSFDGARYELDADWPIDKWAEKNSAQVVCHANFKLDQTETEEPRSGQRQARFR